MTKSNHYDCIVLGFGGVGSQALRHAALQGWKTLGVDLHGPAHNRGSSHGQTRVIRKAYFEHPDYVPLLCHAYDMWDELNKRHRTRPEIKELYTACGILQIGRPASPTIQGVLTSAQQYDLPVEKFSPEQIQQRLPIFSLPDDYSGVFESEAGFLRVELCVAAAIKQAIQSGAELKSGVRVQRWQPKPSQPDTIVLQTDQGTLETQRLIVTAGAWTAQLIPDLKPHLAVLRKQQHWFQLDRVDQKLANRFPAFLVEDESGQHYYGLPEIDRLGMKVCQHSGGRPLASADQHRQELDREELNSVQQFMDQYLQFGRSRLVHHSNCLYTSTSDGHFIIDRHSDCPNVVFAAGLSGHGFKFAPVIGKHLVDRLQGHHDPLFDFLSLQRFQ